MHNYKELISLIGVLCPSLEVARQKMSESIIEFDKNPNKITATKVMIDLNVLLDQVEKNPLFKEWAASPDTNGEEAQVQKFLKEREQEYKLLKGTISESDIEVQN